MPGIIIIFIVYNYVASNSLIPDTFPSSCSVLMGSRLLPGSDQWQLIEAGDKAYRISFFFDSFSSAAVGFSQLLSIYTLPFTTDYIHCPSSPTIPKSYLHHYRVQLYPMSNNNMVNNMHVAMVDTINFSKFSSMSLFNSTDTF